jgi:hypothetical protein
MSSSLFRALVTLIGAAFTLAFAVVVVPPLLQNPDVIGAFAAGFVNPYSSGYSMDVISCWCLLAVWVAHEAKTTGIRHGWVALALGVMPGVATGMAFYLLLRMRHEASR